MRAALVLLKPSVLLLGWVNKGGVGGWDMWHA